MLETINYDDIHKQARLLEGELDLRLTNYNKMCVPKKDIVFAAVHGSLSLPAEVTVDAAASEIQELIDKLDALNSRMTESSSDQLSVKHSMQRHGEILQDYRKEFAKIRENFRAVKERQALMETKSPTRYADGPMAAETHHLLSSEILIDSQLSLALDTKLQLLSQRKSMKKLHTRLRSLYHRFPILNDLIRRIEVSKQKRIAAVVIITLLIVAVVQVTSSNKGLLF